MDDVTPRRHRSQRQCLEGRAGQYDARRRRTTDPALGHGLRALACPCFPSRCGRPLGTFGPGSGHKAARPALGQGAVKLPTFLVVNLGNFRRLTSEATLAVR
jgi:hypothetical protein